MFHIRTRTFPSALIVGGLLSLTAGIDPSFAGQAPAQAPPAQAPPAQAQPAQASPDSELATKIRKAIADDKTIAPYADTLKIIVSDGLVSLKGSVKTEADKKAIGAKADQIAGEKNVMNNLFVSADAAKPAPETP